MKITEFAINKKTVSYFLIILIIGGGIWAFQKLGKLEFPSFTIKTAVVMTPYTGASAQEVEQEVTDRLEIAVQEMAQIKKVRSISQPGLSVIYVDIKNNYDSKAIPQIWDELRRKVGDAQVSLPPGAGPSLVNDDFGDVYGVFFALTGEGFTYQELKNTADLLKRELLLVNGVANVALWGDHRETIDMELSRARMADLGISVSSIINTLNLQNQVSDAGRVTVDTDYIRINPTGAFPSIDSLGDLLIQSDKEGNLIYLKDVVTIRHSYEDPPQAILRHNGKPAIGIGISTVDGGNVVHMGRAVRERLHELQSEIPMGMELSAIAYQADLVAQSVKNFLINLVEAVVIVIAVLCLTMGMSSGLLMGAILLLTILGTFIGMHLLSIDFQMISLGALILALGMLVDNAIVVTEGILVKVHQGMGRRRAALETVNQTAWPLVGATLVAILAFAAIGTSKDTTGEFLNSLFLVMAMSLGLSWVFAITLTPLFCIRFLPKVEEDDASDPYGSAFYRGYRTFLDVSLNHRLLSVLVLVALFFSAMAAFRFIPKDLFPNDSRNQLMINYWRPQGTHISEVEKDLLRMEDNLGKLDNVTDTTLFLGRGSLRFVLTYDPEMPNSSYGMVLLTVKDSGKIDSMIPGLRKNLAEGFPDADIEIRKFRRGPGEGAQVQARFIGPDKAVLRELAEKARIVMADNPNATAIRSNWRQPVMTLRPRIIEAAARRMGINRSHISNALSMTFSGKTVGVFRQGDTLLPIRLKAPESDRASADRINDVVVISPVTGGVVPLRQIVSGMAVEWEDSIIHRLNRKRTLTVGCNPISGTSETLWAELAPKMEAIFLPPGYELEWGGDHEHSIEANQGLFQMVPAFFLLMVLTVVLLFNDVRQTLIVFLCLPMISIGVAAGLLLTGQSLGFMCILGYLGLSGMIIKNAVVLIDQINLEIGQGKAPYEALLDSAVSRLRPVTMASLTTVLGMLPLLQDVFFKGMSITIIGGLTFGTVLTLLVVPLLYAMFFKIERLP